MSKCLNLKHLLGKCGIALLGNLLFLMLYFTLVFSIQYIEAQFFNSEYVKNPFRIKVPMYGWLSEQGPTVAVSNR